MGKCGCDKFSGGRGSGIGFVHRETKRVLQFDEPHPGNDLYGYQIKKTVQFLKDIGEIQEEDMEGDKMNTMLEYRGYHATIDYDADDDIFVGEVFGITDSLNFHGNSIDELKHIFS